MTFSPVRQTDVFATLAARVTPISYLDHRPNIVSVRKCPFLEVTPNAIAYLSQF